MKDVQLRHEALGEGAGRMSNNRVAIMLEVSEWSNARPMLLHSSRSRHCAILTPESVQGERIEFE